MKRQKRALALLLAAAMGLAGCGQAVPQTEQADGTGAQAGNPIQAAPLAEYRAGEVDRNLLDHSVRLAAYPDAAEYPREERTAASTMRPTIWPMRHGRQSGMTALPCRRTWTG